MAKTTDLHAWREEALALMDADPVIVRADSQRERQPAPDLPSDPLSVASRATCAWAIYADIEFEHLGSRVTEAFLRPEHLSEQDIADAVVIEELRRQIDVLVKTVDARHLKDA